MMVPPFRPRRTLRAWSVTDAFKVALPEIVNVRELGNSNMRSREFSVSVRGGVDAERRRVITKVTWLVVDALPERRNKDVGSMRL